MINRDIGIRPPINNLLLKIKRVILVRLICWASNQLVEYCRVVFNPRTVDLTWKIWKMNISNYTILCTIPIRQIATTGKSLTSVKMWKLLMLLLLRNGYTTLKHYIIIITTVKDDFEEVIIKDKYIYRHKCKNSHLIHFS